MSSPLVCEWSESTGPQGPHGGCTLAVYEAEFEDPPPVWTRTFKRQINDIPPEQRRVFEQAAMQAARSLMRECREAGF